ncbi:hypothetical protein OAM92_01480 [Acidimicrobiales bacterium]|jgi:hypothetical protein|nr:hypothetical protein [Acidimicrobiales bacterium]
MSRKPIEPDSITTTLDPDAPSNLVDEHGIFGEDESFRSVVVREMAEYVLTRQGSAA